MYTPLYTHTLSGMCVVYLCFYGRVCAVVVKIMPICFYELAYTFLFYFISAALLRNIFHVIKQIITCQAFHFAWL